MAKKFDKVAAKFSRITASPWATLTAFGTIIIWGLTGPIFNFSDGWNLAINSITTVITFLMVFILQNAQARDTKAFHAKLDEIIRAIETADNILIGTESPDIDTEVAVAHAIAMHDAALRKKKKLKK